jgi:hypothetical protein
MPCGHAVCLAADCIVIAMAVALGHVVLCCVLQEAELVRLQGSASAARRRIKSATAATLQELLDRYGGAAAAWTQQQQQQQGAGSPSGRR